jgi:hypothetical protein
MGRMLARQSLGLCPSLEARPPCQPGTARQVTDPPIMGRARPVNDSARMARLLGMIEIQPMAFHECTRWGKSDRSKRNFIVWRGQLKSLVFVEIDPFLIVLHSKFYE